jgi:hypothetical protein
MCVGALVLLAAIMVGRLVFPATPADSATAKVAISLGRTESGILWTNPPVETMVSRYEAVVECSDGVTRTCFLQDGWNYLEGGKTIQLIVAQGDKTWFRGTDISLDPTSTSPVWDDIYGPVIKKEDGGVQHGPASRAGVMWLSPPPHGGRLTEDEIEELGIVVETIDQGLAEGVAGELSRIYTFLLADTTNKKVIEQSRYCVKDGVLGWYSTAEVDSVGD